MGAISPDTLSCTLLECKVSKDLVIVKNYDDIQKAKAENKFYIIALLRSMN